MVLGNCLEVMPTLPKASVPLLLVDAPYSATNHKWDVQVLNEGWWQAASVLMCHQWRGVFFGNARLIFHLMETNPSLWRYELVWQKNLPQGWLDAKKRPLRAHEWIALLGTAKGCYNPQMQIGRKRKEKARDSVLGKNYGGKQQVSHSNPDGLNYPRSVLFVDQCPDRGIHPTQKPVALLSWLIRTYSNEGDMVLDPTAGSGTTAVSACQTGRSVVCIEKDQSYFEVSVERVRKYIRDNLLDVKLEVRK